jgi:hypothetical protein
MIGTAVLVVRELQEVVRRSAENTHATIEQLLDVLGTRVVSFAIVEPDVMLLVRLERFVESVARHRNRFDAVLVGDELARLK